MADLLTLPTPPKKRPTLPPLVTGDHLSREEFHRRYEAMGEGTRAELIEGVVYVYSSGVPSPVSLDSHSEPHLDLSGWVYTYCIKTPGLRRGVDGTVFADLANEAQPDVLLGIPEASGGQTRTVGRNGKEYVAGVPELVAEIAASTASIDLNAKLRAYERNGVREYIVVLTEQEPPEVRWLTLDNGRLVPLTPDPEDGLLKSRVFPGLWLDVEAFLAGDLAKVAAAVSEGCTTDGHAAFTRSLTRPAPPPDRRP
jgi:Uma2 family endonuclease